MEEPAKHGPMTIESLMKCGDQYCHDEFQVVDDLIDGGAGFAERANRYLKPCRIKSQKKWKGYEDSPQRSQNVDLENPFPAGAPINGQDYSWSFDDHASKLALYNYVPHAAGIFDQVSSACSEDPIRVNTRPGADVRHADALEVQLQVTSKPQIRSIMKWGQALYSVNFPVTSAKTVAYAKESGQMDADVQCVDPRSVLDWERVGNEFVWAKIFSTERTRSNPMEVPDGTKNRLTYLTPDEVVSYEWEWTDRQQPPNPKTLIDPVVSAHEFGKCPLYYCDIDGLWAGKRLIEPLLDVIQCESTLRWWISVQGHPIMSAPDPESAPRSIPNTPNSCIIGKIEFPSPQPQAYDGLRKEVESAQDALMSAMCAIAREAMQATQAARQSGVAKELDIKISGYSGFVNGFASALRRTIDRIVADIARYRGEAGKLYCTGLTRLHSRPFQERLANLQTAYQLRDYPQSAAIWEAANLALDANPSLPAEIRQGILDQAEKLMTKSIAETVGDNQQESTDATGTDAGSGPATGTAGGAGHDGGPKEHA